MIRSGILTTLVFALTACASDEQVGLRRLSEANYTGAVHALKKADAEGGSPTTHLVLGYLYQYGLGTDQREDLAKELYEKAMAEGSIRASVCLAVLYMQGATLSHDFPTAIQLLRDASDAGDVHATADLAIAYDAGWGVPKDKAEYERLMNSAGPSVQSDWQRYAEALRNRVDNAKYYPQSAVSAHHAGTVGVEFDLIGSRAVNIHITRSSGYKDLDEAGIRSVWHTPFLPPDFGYLAYGHYLINITYSFD